MITVFMNFHLRSWDALAEEPFYCCTVAIREGLVLLLARDRHLLQVCNIVIWCIFLEGLYAAINGSKRKCCHRTAHIPQFSQFEVDLFLRVPRFKVHVFIQQIINIATPVNWK